MAKGKSRLKIARLHSFWQRTSDGLNAEQLWAQFRRETRSSLSLYSAETGRNLREEWSARKGRRRVLGAVAGAMYARLTPVRRLLLLLAIVLLLLPTVNYSPDSGLRFALVFNSTPAAVILLALLVLELADRVGLKRDLEIARDIQTGLLPRALPIVPGFSFLGGSLPAKVVGGDFYDFIPFEDRRLGVVLGDVSGKSVPAALLMVASKEIVYSRALTTPDPGLLFQESNRRIYSIKRRMFVSLGYFLLDPDSMTLRYAIGGQPLPILVRAGDGGPRALEPPEHRLPLGAFREVPYDTKELFLKKGDLIFFYTDGFSEAMDEKMEPFGEDRLMSSVERWCDRPLEEVAKGILGDIRSYVDGAEQYDDMTFLLLRAD
jgi:serine phosphatase RsbU (regulator of sigma subunit)